MKIACPSHLRLKTSLQLSILRFEIFIISNWGVKDTVSFSILLGPEYETANPIHFGYRRTGGFVLFSQFRFLHESKKCFLHFCCANVHASPSVDVIKKQPKEEEEETKDGFFTYGTKFLI